RAERPDGEEAAGDGDAEPAFVVAPEDGPGHGVKLRATPVLRDLGNSCAVRIRARAPGARASPAAGSTSRTGQRRRAGPRAGPRGAGPSVPEPLSTARRDRPCAAGAGAVARGWKTRR